MRMKHQHNLTQNAMLNGFIGNYLDLYLFVLCLRFRHSAKLKLYWIQSELQLTTLVEKKL